VIRVAITTDRFESAALPFGRLGFEPVPLPCIRVDPAGPETLAVAREAASSCELLLITSVRTVDLLWPGGLMPNAGVAAVGERTSAAVVARGGRLVASGRAGLADLVEQLGDRLEVSRTVFLHGAGSHSKSEIPMSLHRAMKALRERAADLREFEVYRTTSRPAGSAAVQAAAFASPSAVAGWRLSRSFAGLVVGVIGSTTRLAMAAHRPPEIVAPQPSHKALARAMATYLEVTV
jgi:uroporphyrinogen-III synthase